MSPLVMLVAGVLIAATAGGAGWTANGWRKDAEIATLQKRQSDDVAKRSQAALDDIAGAAKHIKTQAESAQIDVSAVDAKLSALHKEFKNAKPAPLPVDCRPDAVRVRKLSAAANAVTEAIAGQHPGGAVQTAR